MLKFIIFLTIFNCFLIHVKCQLYEAVLDQFKVNDFNEKCVKELTGRVSHYNRTATILNSNMTMLVPADHTKIRMAMFALQGNEFRQIFVIFREDLVNAIKEVSLIYDDVLPTSNLPPKDNLHFPLGFYWIKHYVLKVVPPPIMYAHKIWKMDFVLLNRDDTIFLNVSTTMKVFKRFGF